MNILQVAHQSPYPPNSGGRAGIYYITRGLSAAGHRLRLVCLVGPGDGLSLKHLSTICDTWAVPIDNRNSMPKMVANLFLSAYPYNLSKYYSTALLNLLDRLVSAERPDVVHIDHLHVAYAGLYLKRKYGLPIVLREHNVEYMIMERLASVLKNPAARYYVKLQASRIKNLERSVCSEFDLCLPITVVDEQRLKALNSRCNTVVVSGGVDMEYFSPLENVEEKPFLVHVGTMTWLPNVDGIVWFCSTILPLIRREAPEVRLYVVGANPPKAITRMDGKSGVIVTGYVEDPREIMATASVYVVPLRIGGGMRMKVLDAMAMGKAIVSTPVGCEGIRVTPGKDVLIGDSPQAFANAVLHLLKSPSLRKEIGENALAVARSQYSWGTAIRALESAYRLALDSRNARG